jgi:hypothetical protein
VPRGLCLRSPHAGPRTSSRSAESGTYEAKDGVQETAEISPRGARCLVHPGKLPSEKVMWVWIPPGSEILHQDLHGDWHRP